MHHRFSRTFLGSLALGWLALAGCQPPSTGFTSGTLDELRIADEIAHDHLYVAATVARLAPTARGLVTVSNVVDELAMAHVRVQQTFEGVPVWGGEAIVHLNRDTSLFAITNRLVSGVAIDVSPSVTRDRATIEAVAGMDCSACSSTDVELDDPSIRQRAADLGCACLTAEPEVDLWILRQDSVDHLAWRIQLRREDGSDRTSMPVSFIDAHSGKTILAYDNLQTGTGSSLYSGTVTVDTSAVSSTRYLEDVTDRLGTFDNRNTTSSTSRFTDADDVWNSTSQRAGVDAHYGAQVVYNYYLGVHGRRGIDGNGGPGYYSAAANSAIRLVSSRVHYGNRYNNAFWNGQLMTYGDGDGTKFSPLVPLDVVGHEMTHGVTERTARLIYSGESGALNESMSDVFGAMIERHAKGESTNTWRIGEQCYTPANGTTDALRYMDNPHLAPNSGNTADDHPDHYSERYTGSADNGGVHINSGIANKAFYLLAKGGTHHRGGSMTGIGADAAARIWYRALTTYMTSSTNFAGARTATLNAAAALYGSGSTQRSAVAQAWTLVGVN
jgi:Zn-dependent metalloprotease